MMGRRRSTRRQRAARFDLVQTLVKAGIWDRLSDKHKRMIRKMVQIRDFQRDEVPMDDPSWDKYLDDFGPIADQFEATGDLAPMERHIERGYRRVMFAADPRIQKLASVNKDEPVLSFFSPEEVDKILDS